MISVKNSPVATICKDFFMNIDLSTYQLPDFCWWNQQASTQNLTFLPGPTFFKVTRWWFYYYFFKCSSLIIWARFSNLICFKGIGTTNLYLESGQHVTWAWPICFWIVPSTQKP